MNTWRGKPDLDRIRPQVLDILTRDPGRTVASIARELGCTRQSVYKAMKFPLPAKVPAIPDIDVDAGKVGKVGT